MTFMNLNCNVFASYFAIIHLWAIWTLFFFWDIQAITIKIKKRGKYSHRQEIKHNAAPQSVSAEFIIQMFSKQQFKLTRDMNSLAVCSRYWLRVGFIVCVRPRTRLGFLRVAVCSASIVICLIYASMHRSQCSDPGLVLAIMELFITRTSCDTLHFFLLFSLTNQQSNKRN